MFQKIQRQRGSAMLEFIVVGPIITIFGLGIIQYCLMFFAKNQIDHANFMAARAGSMTHANIQSIRDAYIRALIPLYGGGTNAVELAASFLKAEADMTAQSLRIEVLNPTKESFDDHAKDQALNDSYGMRAIPNGNLAVRQNIEHVGQTSGQTLQDANMLKLRITHGYTPKVWMLGTIFNRYQSWLDDGKDPFASQLIARGRIPMVSHVTVEMQSDAIEQKDASGNNLFASSPGLGNNGRPEDPGAPPSSSKPPPTCRTAGCTVSDTPSNTGGGSSGNGSTNGTAGESSGETNKCSGSNCPICNG